MLAVADIGGEDSLSVLRKYYQKGGENPSSSSFGGAAQMALARAGDTAVFEDIVQELHSGDAAKEIDAFQKLGFVGTTRAVRMLAGYLNDSTVPAAAQAQPSGARHEGVKQDTVRIFARQYYAAKALAAAVEDPPTTKDTELYMKEDLEAWQRWWIQNERNYE